MFRNLVNIAWYKYIIEVTTNHLMHIKSVMYAAKNHINCACIDGIPYST